MIEPILTTLSYSAGTQSNVILEMMARGDIPIPKKMAVVNANLGMEDERSQDFVTNAKIICAKLGIPFLDSNGPNLYQDLTTFKDRGLIRLDNPPYWTRNRLTGKVGRMKQKCTRYYKIAPMRRVLRGYLNTEFGVSLTTKRLPKVETWIGFSFDEQDRVKGCKSDVKFITLRFPLVELGMTKAKVTGYYMNHGIQIPPRSVCCACYANGLAYFEDMYFNRPDDWDKAVAVDEAIRDMTQVGIKDEVFVSSSMIPLKDLPDLDFKKQDADYKEYRCNSGVCFV